MIHISETLVICEGVNVKLESDSESLPSSMNQNNVDEMTQVEGRQIQIASDTRRENAQYKRFDHTTRLLFTKLGLGNGEDPN